MGRFLRIATFIGSMTLAGCAAHLSDAALGKVVVYRNGVAYFERVAEVEKGEITLLVAHDKVDDLLKSLTVTDAVTGTSLPISFPSRQVSHGLIRMTIRVPGEHSRRVKLSYVSESPAWKPTYRLTIGSNGKMSLQGWAIVDNVSGEDWKKVVVGVGSTSALSFRYDLWSVRDVHRQTLGHEERFATAPPTATGLAASPQQPSGEATKKPGSITLDDDYTRNIPIPGRTFESQLGTSSGQGVEGQGISFSGSTSLENQYVIDGIRRTGFAGGAQRRSPAEMEEERKRQELYLRQQQVAEAEAAKVKRRNDELAIQLKRSDGNYVIEGIASPSARNSAMLAESMANHLRNELIQRGVAPGKLSVQTRVGAIGEPTTIQVIAQDPEDRGDSERDTVGESTFVSRVPVSIAHEASTMVPIVEQQTAGNVVYLYDALSPRGNEHFAFKAIRFRNPTQKFLEGGTITVFGDDTFVGEGLTEAIAPGASAILPYALDKQVHVEREESFEDAVVGIKGMMTDGAVVEKQRLNTVRFTLHNRSQSDARVYVRHDTDRGWKIKKGPVNLEQLGRMSVFPVELASGEHKTVEIVESAPLTSTLDLTTDAGVDALARYLRANQDDSKFVATAEKLVSAHRSISKKLQRIDHVAGQMVAFRERLDDLHAQVVTLEAVKSKGKLVTSLQERMAEMSARVQKAVIEIVELREQIMLERFAYQDLINELSEMESVPDSSIRHTSSAAFPPRAK